MNQQQQALARTTMLIDQMNNAIQSFEHVKITSHKAKDNTHRINMVGYDTDPEHGRTIILYDVKPSGEVVIMPDYEVSELGGRARESSIRVTLSHCKANGSNHVGWVGVPNTKQGDLEMTVAAQYMKLPESILKNDSISQTQIDFARKLITQLQTELTDVEYQWSGLPWQSHGSILIEISWSGSNVRDMQIYVRPDWSMAAGNYVVTAMIDGNYVHELTYNEFGLGSFIYNIWDHIPESVLTSKQPGNRIVAPPYVPIMQRDDYKIITTGLNRFELLSMLVMRSIEMFTSENTQLITEAIDMLFTVVDRVNEEKDKCFYLNRINDFNYEYEVFHNIMQNMNRHVAKIWNNSCYFASRPTGSTNYNRLVLVSENIVIDLGIALQMCKEYDDNKVECIYAILYSF